MTLRLFVLSPTVVYQAQVNQTDFTYPLDQVGYDNPVGYNLAHVQVGQTVVFGTTPGGDDLGRQRIRKLPTADTFYVGRSSQGTHDGEVSLQDDAWITVYDDYRVWAKAPCITPAGVIYKDGDLAVGTFTSQPPPVANAGAPAFGTVDQSSGVFSARFPPETNRSFAVAQGATITDYQWTLPDGVTLQGGSTLTDPQIVVDATYGFHWLALTVTDSNGQTHTARTFLFARHPNLDPGVVGFGVRDFRRTPAGQELTVELAADLDPAVYPDGTLVLLTDGEPLTTVDRENLLFWGWHVADPAEVRGQRTGTARRTQLQCVDVAGRLKELPAFPQKLENDARRDTDAFPDITWTHMPHLTLDRYFHYILLWHSTALELTDYVDSGTGDAYALGGSLASEGSSLWEQVQRRAQAFVPGRQLTCDRWGRLAIPPDPLLQEVADRTIAVQAVLQPAHYTRLSWTHQRGGTLHWLRGNALQAVDPLPRNADDEPYQPTFFCIAPGDVPAQGPGDDTHGEQVAVSQQALNQAIGHEYARRNAPEGLWSLDLAGGVDWQRLDPARLEWVVLNLPAAQAAQRGLTVNGERGLLHEVSVRFGTARTGQVPTVSLRWERETVGRPAQTVVLPAPDAGDGEDDDFTYTPPIVDPTAPDYGLTPLQDQVAGISAFALFRTADFQTPSSSGGPTWEKVALTEALALGGDVAGAEFLSFVVDPFSPGYRSGSGAVNGWAVSAKYIFRITDFFGGAPAATIIHTFTHDLSGVSYQPQTWRTIQASFGRYQATETDNPWLMVVSHYQNKAGHTGTWALYSTDAGQTWADEVQITPDYSTNTTWAQRANIGVYLSPKTPGYGLTFAYTATGNPAPAAAYATTDWGATWTAQMTAEDPAQPWVRFALRDPSGVLIRSAVGVEFTAEVGTALTTSSLANSGTHYLLVAPPANTKSLTLAGAYRHEPRSTAPGSSGHSENYSQDNSIYSPNEVSTLAFASAAWNTVGTQTFTTTWTRGAGQATWRGNRTTLESGTYNYADFCRVQLYVGLSGPTGQTTTNRLRHTYRVTQIELDDGTIYTPTPALALDPGHGLGGDLHVPWVDNDDEDVAFYGALNLALVTPEVQLWRGSPLGTAGVAADLSPQVDGVPFGVLHQGFKVRAYDGDRSYLLVGGYDAANNQAGVWRSADGGATWSAVLGPVAASLSFGAAFAAGTPTVIYLWGGYASGSQPILVATDGGGSVDSRKGNLGAFAAGDDFVFLGIAGGPG